MRGTALRLVLAFAASLALLPVPGAGAVTTIGSNLAADASSSGCGYGTFDVNQLHCGMVQQTLVPSDASAAGLTAPFNGVIVRWRVKSGPVGPDVVAVGLVLHVMSGNRIGAGSEQVNLPLTEPGIHTYPTRLSMAAGESLAVDTILTNKNKAGIAAPIVHAQSGVGILGNWFGPSNEGEAKETINKAESSELLLNADIEADADRDGYGDETQDLCPGDPAIHAAACKVPSGPVDTTPPTTKLTFAPRQDFLASHKVIVFLRSNEAAKAVASGQLEIGSGRHKGRTILGLTGVTRQLKAKKKTKLRLRVPRQTLEAAEKAIANGKKTLVKVTVAATDTSGNASGKTVAVIRPKP